MQDTACNTYEETNPNTVTTHLLVCVVYFVAKKLVNQWQSITM